MPKASEKVKIKVESNEFQSYLEKFNKEINDGESSIAIVQDPEDDDEEEEDDDEETGHVYMDESGTYYFHDAKDSESLLTNAPVVIREIDEEEQHLIEDQEGVEELVKINQLKTI